MPTVLRVRGYRFFFFSNERNEPAHVHVQSGDGYAKFWLRPVSPAESLGYDARELRRLEQLIVEHQSVLEQAWDDYFRSQAGPFG